MLSRPRSNRGSERRDIFLTVPSLSGAPSPAAAKLVRSGLTLFGLAAVTGPRG